MSHIVANQIRTPKGHVLRSHYRHDYVTYIEDGIEYMVDGGADYLRRSVAPHEEISVTTDDPFDVIREHLEWGTYGKNGRGPFKWVVLADMSSAHIQAVLDTQPQVPEWRRDLMKKELEHRNE